MQIPGTSPRVLHLLAPSAEGGLEQVVTMLSSSQRHDGVHVGAVVTPEHGARHPFIVRLRGWDVPVTPVIVSSRKYFQEYRAVSALVDRLRPAIVHTHGYHADVVGGAVARAKGIPTVSTVHGFTQGILRNRFYEWLQCRALRRADAVIAVSAPLASHLAGAGVPSKRIHCVRNALASLGQPMSRSAARKKLGIGENELVAGWIGRLSQEKGADVMLESLALSDSPWRLSIVGEGREYPRLRQLADSLGIADRLVFHGYMPEAGLLLTAFDAFVLSSRTEGTPITLLEAMRASVPIVATRVGGVPDVVTSAEALLVPPQQPGRIASALGEIVADPSAAAERSRLARQKADRVFGPDAWVAEITTIYESVAS